MSGPTGAAAVQEVQARFPNDATLQDALTQLGLVGYDRSDFSLPEDQLDPASGTLDEDAGEPTEDASKRQLRTMAGGMAGTVAAFALAGATIATGGAAGVAALGAAALGAGTTAATAAATTAAEKASDRAGVAERDERGAEGTLLLAVRTRGDAQVQQVTEIVRAAGATDMRPVTRPDEVLTAGVSSASWTGN